MTDNEVMCRGEWTAVAELSGNDYLTHTHVESLLLRNKIPSQLSGSKVYYLSVHSHDAAAALCLISSDVAKWGYPIRLVLGQNKFVDHPALEKHKENRRIILTCPHDKVVNSSQFTDEKNILCAIRELDERVQRFPYLREIRLVRREYLSEEGILAHGDEITIDLSENLQPDSPTLSVSSVVWDDGNEYHYLGSLES